MAITYKPLWKLLIDKNIKKKDLCKMADISPATVTKMGSGKHINTDTIDKICIALECNVEDIMEVVR